MKVVALISGGKDSCYAMMKCIQYGHEIVALANLIPQDNCVDELDSYMYQTVGHQLVECYGECMGLPLFRRRIKGSSKQFELQYTETAGDEVEDLFVLLKAVKRQIPGITAVSSGAIASDYQRLRVESVCSRLGLVSLAYLWKQDQSSLLREMISNNIAAITVKVASMGLLPEKHLGKDIADLEPHLQRLNELYGVNVCGEGGEYETLTLDCPLFCNAKIILDKYEIISHSSDSIAPVGVLHPVDFHLENKHSAAKPNFIISEIEDDYDCDVEISTTNDKNPSTFGPIDVVDSFQPTKRNFFSICSPLEISRSSRSLEEDLILAMIETESHLRKHGCNWSHVVYIHLFINDMNEFSKANDIYFKFITQQKCPFGVPSRSTVEVPLSKGHVLVEALVSKDQCKEVLHVQSVSSWAPSCIGPYSQATLHKGLLHMAGQLGLDPPTMSLSGFDPTAEIEQSLRNCEAVANSFGLSITTCSIQMTVFCSRLMPLPIREKIHEKIVSLLKTLGKTPPREPMFLYLVVSDLPKRALVEMKPILCGCDEAIDTTPCGWGFWEADWHGCCVERRVVDRKRGAFVTCIRKEQAFIMCGAEVNVEMLSKLSVYLLDKAMADSGFLWENAVSLRAYFPATADMTIDTVTRGFINAMNELRGLHEESDVAAHVMVTVVPVLAVGSCSSFDAILACELLATIS